MTGIDRGYPQPERQPRIAERVRQQWQPGHAGGHHEPVRHMPNQGLTIPHPFKQFQPDVAGPIAKAINWYLTNQRQAGQLAQRAEMQRLVANDQANKQAGTLGAHEAQLDELMRQLAELHKRLGLTPTPTEEGVE